MAAYITIDEIVKSWLLRREYPMHWYLQGLKHATDCVRDLRVTSMPVVSTAVVVPNEYGGITLPDDFASLIRIGWPNGQFSVPLVQGKGSFLRPPNRNNDGSPKPYEEPSFGNPIHGQWGLHTWFNVANNFGERMGAWYGYGAGFETDIHQLMMEHNELRVSQELAGATLYMDYRPDSNNCDHLSRIPDYAQPCIEQYINWQMKANNRNYGTGDANYERELFNKQHDILRAQVHALGKDDILRGFRRGHHQSSKA